MNPVIPTTLGLLFAAMIIYFGFFRGHAANLTTPAELAGRAVLLGTFSATIYMLIVQFSKGSGYMFPAITEGVLTFNGLAVAIYVILQLLASADAGRETRIRIIQAQQKALDHPDNIKFAWNLAAATLESYLDRNLAQVKWIFNIAVLSMICGFVIIGYGVSLALDNTKFSASVATSAAGLITQFISASFMVIYRSTMTQANSYVTLLERLNNIGMAVQLLDGIPADSAEIRNSTRTEILRYLIKEDNPGRLAKVGSKSVTTTD